jgi:hypothetical protein
MNGFELIYNFIVNILKFTDFLYQSMFVTLADVAPANTIFAVLFNFVFDVLGAIGVEVGSFSLWSIISTGGLTLVCVIVIFKLVRSFVSS